MNLVHLLQFYGDRTLCVPPTDAIPNFHDDDDDEEDEKELDTIKDVMRNQKACLGVLASHLGLDFDRIEKEAEKVTGYQQRARLIRPTSERRGQEDEPDQKRPRTKARIQAQADRTDQDGRIQTQVRATQEQSSGTSITSPRSNASGPHLGAHPSSSTSGISDSLATQRLSHGSDDDAS